MLYGSEMISSSGICNGFLNVDTTVRHRMVGQEYINVSHTVGVTGFLERLSWRKNR